MNNVPTPAGRPRTVIGHIDGVPQLGDIWDGYGRVHDAVLTVLDFGRPGGLGAEQITRDQAAGILRLTGWADRLTERERAAVLRRFPEVVDHDGGDR